LRRRAEEIGAVGERCGAQRAACPPE
jgi:hypothetical protein